MGRIPVLKYDKGTLILHPPAKGNAWIDYATWDDRIEKFRIRAIDYRVLVETLQKNQIQFLDYAKEFVNLELFPSVELEPFPHQQEALLAWKQANRQGVVVLPTGSGKTYLAQLAMQSTPRSSLIIVPTLDLMHQWYAHLKAVFPDAEIGLLGGGSRDRTSILIATYNSAAIYAEALGNQYALLIFDECHHLPTDFFRVISEYSIAPYRLGLTATPDRSDGSHRDLDYLIGQTVYQRTPAELSGNTLAAHQTRQIKVKLSPKEKERYQQAIKIRNDFLRQAHISLGSLQGWQLFVKASACSRAGRQAMLAHREAKEIALGTEGKLRVLADLISQHYPEALIIFTNDNATVYRISEQFLIPAITHQTPVKERHEVLQCFREGIYKTLVTSHVLNEGVDVPEAKVAVILSGTSSTREYIQRLGRILRQNKDKTKLAILYEVIAEDTTEELTSKRRRGLTAVPEKSQPKQLEIPKHSSPYEVKPSKKLLAAEDKAKWNKNKQEEE